MINWTKLIVRNASTNQILDGADRMDALREFRARETMLLGTFERTGGDWETDEPHTWGPQFADDVDWSGFDGDEVNGYTFTGWLTAAGRTDSASEYDLRAAWRAGEDPSEYR